MKPGSVDGPIRVQPTTRGVLADWRNAKKLQDFMNHELFGAPEFRDHLNRIGKAINWRRPKMWPINWPWDFPGGP